MKISLVGSIKEKKLKEWDRREEETCEREKCVFELTSERTELVLDLPCWV